MGVISDPAFSPGQRMVRDIQELKRQLRELAASRRLESSTIGAGGLTIRGGALTILDDAGNVTAVVGKLPDSANHGIAALNPVTGALVELDALAFGHSSAIDTAGGTTTSTSFGNLSGANVGPSVTFNVGTSGVAVVAVGARISWGGAANTNYHGGLMGFDLDGPTSSNAGGTRFVEAGNDNQIGGSYGVGRSFRVDGLTPGEYTAVAKYRAMNTGGPPISFSQRYIEARAY